MGDLRGRAFAVVLGVALAGCAQRERPPRETSDARRREPETTRGAETDPAPASPVAKGPPLVVRQDGPTSLPPPRLDHPATLMRALEARRSTRSFADEQLPAQVLSDLLWAAAGVNRPGEGKRTAPTARNRQEIDLYVALDQGLFLYRCEPHDIEPIVVEDLRALTGTQDYVAQAPVNLVYVADLSKMEGRSEQERLVVSAADVGFMAQNVYLYGAAEGLAVVARGSIDHEALGGAMKLRPEQRIVLAQSVGYARE